MTKGRWLALPLVASALVAQTKTDFRKASWGMDRTQVVATEGAQPSQVGERGGAVVLRYDAAKLAGLECRVVYIFAKDQLVRTKYVFQREHAQKNDFLADFTLVDAFLRGELNPPTDQRVSWHDETYKEQPEQYGVAVSLGQLLYSTQWNVGGTVVTHALTGEKGQITHEVEYVSVNLEALENQIAEEESPTEKTPRPLQLAVTP